MEKKTVLTIWGIYGLVAIAGSVASLVWTRKQMKQWWSSTPKCADEETE